MRMPVRSGRVLTLVMAAGCLAALAAPALAQEPAAPGRTTFTMFFWSENLLGLLITWLLVLLSTVGVALMLLNVMRNRAGNLYTPQTAQDLRRLLNERRYQEAIARAKKDESVFGQIMFASLNQAPHGFGAMARTIHDTADVHASRRIRSLELLNVLGAVGPMLGLFGTVYGMIVAFQTIVATGGQPRPQDLAAGISTALVTTFWGLVVGIPALASYALLRNKVDALTAEATVQAETLISPFQPRQDHEHEPHAQPTPQP